MTTFKVAESTGKPVDTMSLREFSELLGVSYTTAHQLAQRDELPIPALKVGRQYRFSRIAYRRLLEEQHRRGPA